MDEMLHYYECKGSKIISLNDLLWQQKIKYRILKIGKTGESG